MSTATTLEMLCQHPLLQNLPRDILAKIVEQQTVTRIRPGRRLLEAGDTPAHVFFLLKGSVRIFHRHEDGRELTVKFFRGPAMFGEMEIMCGLPFLEYAKTLDYAEFIYIPAATFNNLLRQHPSFCEAVAKDLAARLCVATHNEKSLAFADVETRLANLLIDYLQLYGEPQVEPQGKGMVLNVKISQESLAHDLAVSRKSVTRVFEKLSTEGLLAKQRGRFVVLDPQALAHKSNRALGLSFRSFRQQPNKR